MTSVENRRATPGERMEDSLQFRLAGMIRIGLVLTLANRVVTRLRRHRRVASDRSRVYQVTSV